MRTYNKMITEVSKAIAQVVTHGPAEQTWFVQQEIINEIEDNYKIKELDEETLRAMIQTAGKAGSPGDDKIMFVSQVASGQTSDIASKRDAFRGTEQRKASGSRWREAAGVVKSWASGWWEGRGGQTKMAFLERRIQQPMEESRKNCQKCLAGRKGI